MMKVNKGRHHHYWSKKLGLTVVLLFCFFSFLLGLIVSAFINQDISNIRPRPRLLKSIEEGREREREHNPLPHGNTGEPSMSLIPFQVLSWKPRALYFPSFATSEQCESIINMAKVQLKPSTLALRKGETVESTQESEPVILRFEDFALHSPASTTGRRYASFLLQQCSNLGICKQGNVEAVSLAVALGCFMLLSLSRWIGNHGSQIQKRYGFSISGMFISASEDKTGVLDLIEQKIAKVTMIPSSHGEAFNVLRYEIGQRYQSHYDAFHPAEYGPQKSQRVASFLLYLSDVEEGGETMFPFENGVYMDSSYDFKKCIGLKVKPRKGDGLLFYSVFPNGTIDELSLHGSCPVIKGEKWVATKWIRDREDED